MRTAKWQPVIYPRRGHNFDRIVSNGCRNLMEESTSGLTVVN